jgi:hypothetical protein
VIDRRVLIALCLAAALVAVLVPFAAWLACACLVLTFFAPVLEPVLVPVRRSSRQPRRPFLRVDPFRGPPRG